MFVGTDLDGLLASKILACLFRQDDVPYRLIPVGGYEELDRRKTEVAESGEVCMTWTEGKSDFGSTQVAAYPDIDIPRFTAAIVVLLPGAADLSPSHHRCSSSLEPSKPFWG